ncbi:MAG: FAD-dependent oxidoreductase [Clostridia bacterium]|nr:FAD-dependent oxidoreductase [Clostridia bacterium]
MQKLIIIGGGPAGYTAAIRAAQLAYDVTLIEENKPGGTCLNKGCIPTKALLQSSHTYSAIKSGAFGITAEGLHADVDAVFARVFDIVAKLGNGIQALLKSNNIKYINARARLKSPTTVELPDGEIIEGDKLILATGASPVRLPIEGIELALTSDEVLRHAFSQHKSVVIVGGGVVGIELATFFSELDCAVTVIDAMDSILSTMGEDIPKYISMSLRKKAVKFALKASVKSFRKTDGGIETVYVEKDKEKSIVADIVISCVGRTPNGIDGIENTGIVFDRGFVTNTNGQTAEPGIYAIGDCVKGNIQLAHFAAADATRVVEGLNNGVFRSLANVPSCVYTSPNAALVGVQEKECAFEIQTGRFGMSANGKTMAEGGGTGYIKVVFEKQSGRLVGAEMVCNSAAELAGFVANLINIGATREDILSSVYPHPSVSEGFFEAVEDSIKKSVHTIYRN